MIRAAMGIPEARIAPLHVRLSVVCGICGSSDGCMYCLGCFWISYITEITTVSAGRLHRHHTSAQICLHFIEQRMRLGAFNGLNSCE